MGASRGKAERARERCSLPQAARAHCIPRCARGIRIKDSYVATANFIGVYSSMSARRRQGGAPRKNYWFVWEDQQGRHIVQMLDAAYNPIGAPERISDHEFSQLYRLESSIFVTPISKLEIPDAPPDETAGAPDRQPVSLDIPEELVEPAGRGGARQMEEAAILDRSLRDEFATAMSRLQRGEKAAAVNALERLANRREGIVPAHKHMFTDFAVNLRKSRLPAVAFKFYERALELSPEDSNAYFNMARIMFDLGDYAGTEKHLQQALNLDVEFAAARRFLEYLEQSRPGKNKKRGTGKKDDAGKSLSLTLK